MAQKLRDDKIGQLTHSAGNIIMAASVANPAYLTIGGQQYKVTSNLIVALPTLTANGRYQVFAVLNAGVVELRISQNENSVGPAGFNRWKLIGSLYANGNTSVAFGNFVNITGVPRTLPISYTMTIGASTTPPTKGGTVTEQALWWREGSKIFVKYDYQQGSAGANGAGLYLFPTPSGFSLNTNFYQNVGNQIVPVLGYAEANNSSPSNGTGYVSAFNNTNLIINVTNSGSASVAGVTAANYALGFAGATTYSFKAEFEASGLTNTPLVDL